MASFLSTISRSLRYSAQQYGVKRSSMLLPRRSLCVQGQPKDMVRVTDFDKKTLLKAKIYNSAEEIPEYVTHTKIRKARDLMRIRVNIWMVIATVGGCIFMIIYGRHLRDSGDSLQKRGLEWQAGMREQGLREEAERKAKASAAS